jgi:endonuclease/exonuclease/phosphatase family metal-dependent hydrolase
LRVATLNIHKGRGLDGREDLDRLAAFLSESGADLIGLQEVIQSSRRNQPEFLAKKLGMEYAFFPSLRRCTYRYGNALLSRWPLEEVQGYVLPSLREKRSLLTARCRGPLSFTAAVTHLGLNSREREGHAAKILEILGKKQPVILMGDWNASSESQEVQAILEEFGDAFQLGERSASDTHTYLSRDLLPHRIDYIFVRGFTVVRYFTRGTIATDHRLVAADLQWAEV